MQPNFTLKKLRLVSIRIFAIAMILGLTTQTSFSQNNGDKKVERRVIKNQKETESKKQKQEFEKAISKLKNSPPSVGRVPIPAGFKPVPQNMVLSPQVANPLSRAFPYTVPSDFQLNSQFLSNTVLTPIGSPVVFGFNGANAWNTLDNKLYAVDQAPPFSLYTVDTTTGVRTFVANCTGVPFSNMTGITWDPFTNVMYGVSTDDGLTVAQILTINITTGACTTIGSPTATAGGSIMINAAPDGTLFSVDIVDDNLYKWNKTTGVPTLVGPTGVDANYGQDGHFDFSDGQYYWACLNNTNLEGELRVINTTTGASTLIGSYGFLNQISGIGIYSIPLIPCSGTPDPGDTKSSDPSICAAVPFTLSLENPIYASGITFQWQSATSTAGPWTDIIGATTQNYGTTLTATTSYRCVVTCTNSSITTISTPLEVTLTPAANCYCDAEGDDTSFEIIDNVKFGTIDNASSSLAGYENFLTISTDVVKGQTLPITIESLDSYDFDQVLVWIDFNKNGSFSDAGELVYSSPVVTGPYTGNITIPAGATTGSTRMRIRLHDSFFGPNATPCGNSDYGQVEDYTVNIIPCVSLNFTSSPSNASITCGGTAVFTATVTGTAPAYAWEYRVNSGSPWLFVPNASPFSGVNTNALTITDASQTYSGYQFRLVASNPCNAPDFSGFATLTVNPIVPVVTPSSATICLGTIQKLTLTNTLGNSNLLSEGFTVADPLPAGWASQNNSSPVGTSGWFQGNTAVFNAQSGPADSYIGANFNNTTGANTISNWLFLPTLSIKNGDIVTFWTRTATGATYPDRLEVRVSGNGASTNVGATNTSVGDFATLLLSVNPTLIAGPSGYPDTWTQFTATVSGLGAPTTGRVAFRYFVTNGGPSGANSNYIGIDNVVYTTTGGAAQGTWTGPAGTMFTDALAATAYTGTLANAIYVKPTVTSNYQVSFTTGTPCTSATTTVPVNVVIPISGVANPTNTSVCLGGTATFTSASATGGPFVRQWQVSTNSGLTWTNITGATSSTLTLTNVAQIMNNNLYRVNYTAAPCVGTVSSNSAKLTVNPLPVVTISAPDLALTPGQTTVITGSSSPAAISWSWTRDGAAIAGATNTQSVNIDKLGAYQATVVDNQTPGCTAKSNVLVIGSESSDRLWIYPNPTAGAFQARLYFQSDFSEKRIVTIYNSLGQEITSKRFNLMNITAPYLQMDFDLTNMPRGTYVVKVAHEFTGKIVSGLVLVQ